MKHYEAPEAFKQALEQRIRKAAAEQATDIGRFRQLLVFDRFLARVHSHFKERVVVKGGVVLELRLERARTTKDVDLRILGSPTEVLEELQTAGRLDLGDWLTFEIQVDRDHPIIRGPAMVDEGHRFRAEARLAGTLYAARFGVDVSFADALTQEPDLIQGSDFLSFIGLSPTSYRVYPRSTHIAEKLHAYTLPRQEGRTNTRLKDLPDLALLSLTDDLRAADLLNAIDATFSFRGTHEVPTSVQQPPSSWEAPYERLVATDQLPWDTLDEAFAVVASFLNPALSATIEGDSAWRTGRGWN